MSIPLTDADFRLTRAVCEIRYEDAYLIYDHTGRVFHDLRGAFAELHVVNASPNQSAFKSREGHSALELGQSRFISDQPDSSLEVYAGHCKRFFDVVTEQLEVRVFSRIGLRLFFLKSYKDHSEAKKVLDELDLVKRERAVRFGASELPVELMFRWENEEIGTLLRLKAEKGTIDVVLPPELELEKKDFHKNLNGLLIDIDSYTVAPVECSQWNPEVWIPQRLRTIRREVNNFIEH